MKESFYFPHDNNAHNDPKLMTVFMKTGLAGVGLYWIIIELLHQQESGMITYEQYEDYIRWYSMREKGEPIAEQLLNIYLTTELFCKNEKGFIYSKRVIENKKFREKLSEKRSEAGKKSALARLNPTSVEQKGTFVEQGKERKGKERKKKETEKQIYISEYSKEFQELYESWLKDRKTRKKPVTEKAMELQLKRCRQWGEQKSVSIIQKAIEKGWTGLEDYDSKDLPKPRGIDYAAENKKTLDREKLANDEKRKEQDESDRKKRDDDKILRWLESLPESRLSDIEIEINESPLVDRLRPPSEDDPEEERKRKNSMIKTARNTARILIARKYYFQEQ